MKRWILWSSIGASVVSLLSAGAYAGWQYFRGEPAAETAQAEAPTTLDAKQPPAPVPFPDGSGDDNFAPVRPANYEMPSPAATVYRGNDGAEPTPAKPSALTYEPSSSAFPMSVSDSPQTSPDTAPPADTYDPRMPSESGSALGAPIYSPMDVPAPEVPNRGGTEPAQFPVVGTDQPDLESTTAAPGGEPRPFTNEGIEPSRLSPAPMPAASPGYDVGPSPSPSAIENPSPGLSSELMSGRTFGSGRAILASQSSAATAELVQDAPGERRLEGEQTPMLSLQKTAPPEIQVGKPAKFGMKVKNIGQVPAHGVVVTDPIPQGTEFLESAPPADRVEGMLRWDLGTVQPGEEVTISVDLMPRTEGWIGSVAQMTFHAQAAVRTIATRPQLVVEQAGPAKVLIGEDVQFHITVSNPGSGVATGVVVEVDVPEQLAHAGGREIMSLPFDLRPNETHKLDLTMRAVAAGAVQNVVRAVGEGSLKAEHRSQVEVTAPQLQLAIQGPTRRYLQRQVTYQVQVSNPGTAAAHDIVLVAQMPQGLKFVAADNKGAYDQAKHAVRWSLEELPPGESGVVQVTALPIGTGDQRLHVEGRAALELAASQDHTTTVEALTELVFTVSDVNDPIEVGAETAYEIRITNNGSKVATNVQMAALLPPELTASKVDGPTQGEIQGQQIVMAPLSQLRPGEEVLYRVLVRGQKAGDHIIRVQLVSDEVSTPVTKEESTKVYADE